MLVSEREGGGGEEREGDGKERKREREEVWEGERVCLLFGVCVCWLA